MTYDIYGNVLTPGFCEVHPHIRQEYPCSQCLHERDADDKQRIQYEKDQRIAWLTELADDAENILGEIAGDNDHNIAAWRERYRLIVMAHRDS